MLVIIVAIMLHSITVIVMPCDTTVAVVALHSVIVTPTAPCHIVVMAAVIRPCGVAVTVVVLCSATVTVTIIAVSGWAMVGPGGRGQLCIH